MHSAVLADFLVCLRYWAKHRAGIAFRARFSTMKTLLLQGNPNFIDASSEMLSADSEEVNHLLISQIIISGTLCRRVVLQL